MTFLLFAILIVALGILFAPSARKKIYSAPLLKLAAKAGLAPRVSKTERLAIESGQVGPERDFFNGNPDYDALREIKMPSLSQEEKEFLSGPVERLCQMADDWKVWSDGNLSPEVWEFLKKEKFFGMIIPKNYGGLEFSRLAHSQVIAKLASRSVPLAVTTMVPNSLGPAELLLKYGTEEQKELYLPRLADGREIPCFGLTEPHAGSDASSLSSSGVLFMQDGEMILRLNWNKRWITLGAVATLIGIAFELKDPDNLLGRGESVGITCALVPANTPGIKHHQRHDPLGVPFINSPLYGEDVIVPVSSIIGGIQCAGKGWLMLTESLAAGRGISLPSQSAASAKKSVALTTAHSAVRNQFGLSLWKFEGVQEPLARILGGAYTIEATKDYALGAMDQLGSLGVISAIAKYNTTEMARDIVTDAMDIMGGAGISRGPANQIAHSYISQPIGITVEGANILTRTLMIFGQGALRGHPHTYTLLNSIKQKDLEKFDQAFWGFNLHLLENLGRSMLHFFTRAKLIKVDASKKTKRYYQKLSWASARFACMTDLAMVMYGSGLKQREFMAGRFADALSWQFMALATLQKFEQEGEKERDELYFRWSMENAFEKIQSAFEQIYKNINVPVYGWWKRHFALKLIRLNSLGAGPNDKLTHKVCVKALSDMEARESLMSGIFLPTRDDDPQSALEKAFLLHQDVLPIYKAVKAAKKSGQLPKKLRGEDLYILAADKKIITETQLRSAIRAEKAKDIAIAVDHFEWDEFKETRFGAPWRQEVAND